MLLRSGLLAVGLGLGARASAPPTALARTLRPSRAAPVATSLRSLATRAAPRPRPSSVLAELRGTHAAGVSALGLGIKSPRSAFALRSAFGSSFGSARTFSSTSTLLERLGRIRPKRIAIPIQGAAEAGGLPEQSIFVPILVRVVYGSSTREACAIAAVER